MHFSGSGAMAAMVTKVGVVAQKNGFDPPRKRQSANTGQTTWTPLPGWVRSYAVSCSRSSSREVRIRVPLFLESILVGEPSPQEETVKGHYWGT